MEKSSFDARLMRLVADNKELRGRLREPPGPPGGGPHDPDMETLAKRVEKLEEKLEGFDGRMRAVETGLSVANAKLDALDGRFDDLGKRMDDLGRRMDDVTRRFDSAVALALGRVPSWWQMPVVIAGTIALLTGLYAGAKHLGLVPP